MGKGTMAIQGKKADMGDLPRKAVVSIVTMSNYHIKTSYKISKQNNEMLMFVDTSADVAVLWLS